MKIKVIGVVLLLTGAMSTLFGLGQLTRFTHLHTPSSYLVDTHLLNSAINDNEELKHKLRDETRKAQQHIDTIFQTHAKSSIGLVLSGGFQSILGILLVYAAKSLGKSQPKTVEPEST